MQFPGLSGILPRGSVDSALARLFPEPDPHIHDPKGWINERLGEFVWSKQVEILESVRDNRYTAVQSCHDAGKSYIAARAVAWWLAVHPIGSAFAVTTAPTTPQVEAILWREIGQAHRKAGLQGRVTLDARWYMGAEGKDLVAYGRKPADYDDTAFQGIHARYVLVVVDEAVGIPEGLFDAVDSLVTNADSRVLAIGNPDDPASHFAKICKPGSGWNRIRIDAYETPNFTDEPVPDELRHVLISKEWVEERRKRWGENSPLFTAKVRGLFPEVTDDTLIQPSWIERAIAKDLSPLAILTHGQYGADVARRGDNESVVYLNRGGHIRLVNTWGKQDSMVTAGKFFHLMEEKVWETPMVIDVTGLGAGVYDRLVELEVPNILPFDASAGSVNVRRFQRRRDEAWWNLRTMFEDGEVDLDPEDEELHAQLGSIKYKVMSNGKIKVESKEDMLKRKMPSPDRADACMMAAIPVMDYADMTRRSRENALGTGITDDLLTRNL